MPTPSAQLDGRIEFYGTYAALAAQSGSGIPAGTRSWCSDIGDVFWNGTRWVVGDTSPIVVSGLPLCILPTGSAVSAVGAVTLSTTLPLTAGAGYFYVPTGYYGTASVAGWYYGTIQSGTAVTLFNNTFSGTGQPTVPAAPVAFAGLSGATPTGSTGAITALTVNVPANCMGPMGSVVIDVLASFNNSASNKIITAKFGTMSGPSITATTTTSLGFKSTVRNSGVTNVQVMSSAATGDIYAAAAQTLARAAIDTTAVVAVTLVVNNAIAADFIILESYGVSITSF